MIESKEKPESYEVIKIEFEHPYDIDKEGHRERMVDELYSIVYPNGLEICLGRREGEESWGHWHYDFKTDKKSWIVVDIPENPRVKTEYSDGVFIEMGILADKWLETHEDLSGDEYETYIHNGIRNFLERTGQV